MNFLIVLQLFKSFPILLSVDFLLNYFHHIGNSNWLFSDHYSKFIRCCILVFGIVSKAALLKHFVVVFITWNYIWSDIIWCVLCDLFQYCWVRNSYYWLLLQITDVLIAFNLILFVLSQSEQSMQIRIYELFSNCLWFYLYQILL